MKETKNFFVNNNRLNKGYSKVNNTRDNDNSFYRKKFEHVLPPVELMKEYEELYPNTMAKLITMAEKEQVHRHQMYIRSLEVYENITKKGRISSLIFMFVVCITIIALTLLEHFVVASIFAVSVFLGIGIGLLVSSIKFTKHKDFRSTPIRG